MNKAQLNAQAQAGYLQKRALREKLYGSSYWHFLQYLFYRNRFPLLSRISSRVILALEYYALFQFFFHDVFLSFSFIFIILFYLKLLFDGFLQNYRIQISIADGELRDKAKTELIQQASLFALLYSVIMGGLILITTCFFATKLELIVFVAVKVLLMPLQYLYSVHWMALYTKRREKLSFLFLMYCRVVPLIFLLSLHSYLGIYSFILGTFCGLLLENYYVLRITAKHIKLRLYQSWIKNIQSAWGFHKHFRINCYSISNVAYAIYNIGLAAALLMHSDNYWNVHVIFLYFLILFSYPTQRLAYSMTMDIYLALIRRNLPLAVRLQNHTKFAGLITSIVILFFCGLTILLYPSIFSADGVVVFDLFIYFIFFITGRLLFEFDLVLLRAGAIDGLVNRQFFWILLLILLPLQIYLITFWRANLALIYLLDFIFFVLLTVNWRLRTPLESSPFLKNALVQINRQGLQPPAQWTKLLKTNLRTDHNAKIYLLVLNNYYQQKTHRLNLIQLIYKIFPSLSVIEAVPGTLICFELTNGNCTKDLLLKSLAGHLRYCEELQDLTMTTFLQLSEKLAGLKGLNKNTLKVIKALQLSIVNLDYQKLQLAVSKLTAAERRNACKLGDILLSLRMPGKLVSVNPKTPIDKNSAPEDTQRFAAYLEATQAQKKLLYQITPKPFCLVQNLDLPILLVDYQTCTDLEKQRCLSLAVALTFALSVQELIFDHKHE